MSDIEQIKTAIFNYFDGIRLADRERLERAFAVEAGHMKGYPHDQGGRFAVSSRPIREVIDAWAARAP